MGKLSKIFLACWVVAATLYGEQQQYGQNYRYQYYNNAQQPTQRVQNAQTYQQQQQYQQPVQQAPVQGQVQGQQAMTGNAQVVSGQGTVFTEQERNLAYTTPEKLIAMTPEERKKAMDAGAFDFSDEGAYIDVEDAVHYKQFVHRHLLSKAIVDSEPAKLNRFFINLMTSTSYVHQQGDGINVKWVEFVTGGMQLSAGYALTGGHVLEVGANFSAISNLFGGYRYYLGTDLWTVWPYAGIGMGTEMRSINISDGPDEVKFYRGKTTLINAVIGIVLPLPDVAVRVEVRSDFWGSNRIVVSPSFGLVMYL